MAIQRTLFDDIGPDDLSGLDALNEPFWVARVVFSEGLDGVFDYMIPEHLLDQVTAGMRLLVPLGKSNRPVVVYCLEVCQRTANDSGEFAPNRLKEIIRPLDSKRLLSDKMLELAKWIGQRYLCPLGQVLEAVLPAGVRDHAGIKQVTAWHAVDDVDKRLEQLAQTKKREGVDILTSKQKLALDTLRAAGEPMTLAELARATKSSLAPINALKSLGLLRKVVLRRHSSVFDSMNVKVERTAPLKLNTEQQHVLNRVLTALRNREQTTFLLHGVTGSGKTEVYIQAIEEVVRYGKQAIVLVPEISLTPQTVLRFRCRFDSVAVLHSHLTDAERHAEWTRIASGNVQVVVGARSAIFAPVPHPGIIVIDEEHENSFKQNTAPRYHARDVAVFRGQQEHIPIILGSATPSLESWHQQTHGAFELLSIPHRVLNQPLPRVHIVDLRCRSLGGFSRGAIHLELLHAIQESLDTDGQIILLLNRRGFSTQIQCPQCGEVVKCPHCDVSLTHHFREQIALCHYCDYQIPAPQECPSCHFTGIRYSGFGTEKLQQELTARFPGVPLLRMDTDTMQAHGSHQRALDAFREGKYRILLGTQMIAKGLDFPNVTLVGVVNADTALHLPDFRAAERTFYLITQVAGRTGRGDREGQVIVQTYNPDHAAIIAASQHDYHGFVEKELELRRGLLYPPYSSMIRIVI
ncbi:MAG: primosomal protein N', partial [Thermoguttaceae bacterium]|nr:primosomal protein N' [Thermoguttaceae bacterium]